MVKIDNTFENNRIVVGENAEENDQLIVKAKQNDMWFHLEDFSSCHVIMTCTKKYPVTKPMIKYCAELCKQNTKYKLYKNISVNYCLIKNVKRTTIMGTVDLTGMIHSMKV